MLGMLVEVADDVDSREHQGILDASPEVHPLLWWGFQMREQLKFSALNNDERIPQ